MVALLRGGRQRLSCPPAQPAWPRACHPRGPGWPAAWLAAWLWSGNGATAGPPGGHLPWTAEERWSHSLLERWEYSLIPGATGSAPAAIAAESPLLGLRQRNPADALVLDGDHVLLADPLFWEIAPMRSTLLWPRHPWHRESEPPRPPHWRGERVMAGARVGSETGDAFLQELRGASGVENKTPMTTFSLLASPLRGVAGWAGLEQVDHFSQRRQGRRRRRVDAATSWIGENLPARSMAGGGVRLEGARTSAGFSLGRGWVWTPSPASGREYPWEVQTASAGALLRKGVRFTASWAAGESPGGAASFTRGFWEVGCQRQWRDQKHTLELEGSGGVDFFRMDAGEGIRSRNRLSFPLRARGLHVYSPAGSPLTVQTESRWLLSTGHWAGKGATRWGWETGPWEFFATARGYLWDPRTLWQQVREEWESQGDTLTAIWAPGGIRTGGALGGGAGWRGSAGALDLAAAWAVENGLRGFESGMVSDAGTPVLERAGAIQATFPALYQRRLESAYATPQWGGFRWGMRGRLRIPVRTDNKGPEPEWIPSTLSGGQWLEWSIPTGLAVKASSTWLSAKRVRGWGPVLLVPPRWEHNLQIEQILWGGRVRGWMAALHAFGDEALEHPAGNPIRFRMIAAGEVRF